MTKTSFSVFSLSTLHTIFRFIYLCGAHNFIHFFFKSTVSGKGESEPVSKTSVPNVYQCYFEDCIPPPPDIPDAPLAERPDDFQRWSDTASWTEQEDGFGSGDGVLPTDGADVMIKSGILSICLSR